MKSNQFRYFVLFANMRTGSNLFERTIENYDSFSCHGELFNQHFVGYPSRETRLLTSLKERERNPIAMIDEMIGLENQVLPGFRLFADHDPRAVAHCLKDEDCAKIILNRNALDSYVSYKIARKTDQWSLGDLHRRVSAKVEFDFAEFQEFLQKRQEYYELLNRNLQLSGQTAFHLNYDDLNDVNIFNGLAKYLGSDEKLIQFVKQGTRQNPERLSEKVTNYDEMYQQVRTLDIFEREIEPYLKSKFMSGSKLVRISDACKVAYFPISNHHNDWTSAWLNSTQGDLRDGLMGADLNNWFSKNSEKLVITSLEQPVERAYDAFCNLLLFKGVKGINWLRNMMIKHYSMQLPDDALRVGANKEDLLKSDYTLAIHRLNFKHFLRFLNGNLKGQTRSAIMHEWDLQYKIIDSYKHWGVPQIVISPHLRNEYCEIIESQLGFKTGPEIESIKPKQSIDLAEIYDAEIEALTRVAYGSDYRKFWFQNWLKID